ncbi:hypothetical protein S245_059229, partial [Arachis hypogaea]
QWFFGFNLWIQSGSLAAAKLLLLPLTKLEKRGCKYVCSTVNKGEEQKKLNVLSNEVFVNALISSGHAKSLKMLFFKLSNLKLMGTLPYGLQPLTSLTNPDLSSNNLGGGIPYQLSPNMQRLNLAYNNFTGAIPYSVSDMTSLTDLNLAHNQFQQGLNVNFMKLSALSSLDLSFNLLTSDLLQTLSSLLGITSMYLQNNQFTGTIDVLANLPHYDIIGL